MSVQEELRLELQDAMRAKDRARVAVIRQVETEVSVAKSAPGFAGEIDDELYETTIAAYVKKMDKARREYEAMGERGTERAAQLAYEVDYLGRWAPEGVDEDETRRVVVEVIEELGVSDPKMAGRVIGQIMKSRNDLDGGLVNRLVRDELGT